MNAGAIVKQAPGRFPDVPCGVSGKPDFTSTGPMRAPVGPAKSALTGPLKAAMMGHLEKPAEARERRRL
jgi:hypothetical protein